MKEILGVLAALAAVAGIASAISDKDEKNDAEEQRRLQELQLEKQRLQMQQDQQKFQWKLEAAPRKAIYKPVSSYVCPRCMGNREIDQRKGILKCPYCDYIERLEVERYEIDHDAFQAKLNEEQQNDAAKKRSQTKRVVKIVAAVFVFFGIVGFLNNQLEKNPSKSEISVSIVTTQATKATTNSDTETQTILTESNGVSSSSDSINSDNFVLSLGGIDWQIPSYFKLNTKDSTDSFKLYSVNWPDQSGSYNLWVGTESLSIQQSSFEEKKDAIQNKLAEQIHADISKSEEITIAGYAGRQFDMKLSTTDGTPVIGSYVFAYNAQTGSFVRIGMTQPIKAEKSITDDFIKILKSAVTTNNEFAHTVSAVSDTQQGTETTSDTITNIKPELFPQQNAFRAAVVAITNALATDVFASDHNTHDTSKYHSFSDTSAFYMNVLNEGTWTEKDNDTWHVDGLTMQPDGYDTVYNAPIHVDTIAKVSLDVKFDGNKYHIANITGMYAIPGRESIGTNLSYLNNDSTVSSALTVSPKKIEKGR